MTPENQKLLYEATRDLLTETMNAVYDPLRKMTDWPGGQSEAYRELASSCAPETHRQVFAIYTQNLDYLIEGNISGNSAAELNERLNRVLNSLSMLQTASSELAALLEPYVGLSGTVRMALEIGTRPWSLLTIIAKKHPFQEKRSALEQKILRSIDDFNDAIIAFLRAVEVMVSKYLGRPFSLNKTYEDLVKPCGHSARSST